MIDSNTTEQQEEFRRRPTPLLEFVYAVARGEYSWADLPEWWKEHSEHN